MTLAINFLCCKWCNVLQGFVVLWNSISCTISAEYQVFGWRRKQMQKTFFTSFFIYTMAYCVYIIIAYKQKSRWENKYYLKTFQIDPLLMFLFLCVKDNLFSNFPFQLNAMFVHGNCHYRIPVNFEGHNFVYEEVITTNHIRWRKIISTLLS